MNPVQPASGVDDQGFVDRLSRQAAARGAGQHRHPVACGQLNGSLHVVHRARDEHGQRHFLIDTGVCAVEHAAVLVDPQFAAHARPQLVKKFVDGPLVHHVSAP